jgi:phage N-6-adenine-methyltransferase
VKHFGLSGNVPVQQYKDEWLTPPSILQCLGPFDLDPCAPVVRPWPIAETHFTVEDDGLAQDWSEHGRVWLNPPYSNWSTWAERLACHGNGFALLFARTDTANFERTVWSSATALLFIRGRLKFYHSNGVESSKNGGAPSVIVAYGAECAGVLETCGINGRVVKLDTSVVVPISTQRRLRLEARARRTA